MAEVFVTPPPVEAALKSLGVPPPKKRNNLLLVILVALVVLVGVGAIYLVFQLNTFQGDLRQRASGSNASCGWCANQPQCPHSPEGPAGPWCGGISCCQGWNPGTSQAPQPQSTSTSQGGSTVGLPDSQSSGCCSNSTQCVSWFGAGSTCNNSNGACRSGLQCKGGANTSSCHTCTANDCGVAGCGGQTCNAGCKTSCGNGVCENGENATNCPTDCKATTGACGTDGGACCDPFTNGGKICNSGLYCNTSTGKCQSTPPTNLCQGGGSGGTPSTQCAVFTCGSSCNNGTQCSLNRQVVSCTQADSILGSQCGQIDFLDTGGAYCGVKSQHCGGSCSGGQTTTSTSPLAAAQTTTATTTTPAPTTTLAPTSTPTTTATPTTAPSSPSTPTPSATLTPTPTTTPTTTQLAQATITPSTAKTPAPTRLPDAGGQLPTKSIFSGGVILLLLGILLSL